MPSTEATPVRTDQNDNLSEGDVARVEVASPSRTTEGVLTDEIPMVTVYDDEVNESPRRNCEASSTKLTGCARRCLAGRSCDRMELDRYFLLEDDTITDREESRESYLCAQHGKKYIMLINKRRCSNASCWMRGCLWWEEGGWVSECQFRMQQSIVEQPNDEPRSATMLTRSQLNPNWGKLPAENEEPIEPSPPQYETQEVEQGVAAAAPRRFEPWWPHLRNRGGKRTSRTEWLGN